MDKKMPYILGFEGYGEILETGEGVDKNLIGKKGSFLAGPQYGGYTQYTVTNMATFF